MKRHAIQLFAALAVGLAAGAPVATGADGGSETTLKRPMMAEEPLLLPESEVVYEDAADPDSPIEVVRDRYPSGAIRSRFEVARNQAGDYILHGEWKLWDEGGTLVGAGQYTNHRRHGTWIRVHPGNRAKLFSMPPYQQFTGPFTSEAEFSNGKLHGTWIIYDHEHRKISEWEYADGLREGVSLFYYPSGSTLCEMVFHEGLLDGYFRTYDEESNLTEEAAYQLGQKVAPKIEYDEAGRKKSEGVYLYAGIVRAGEDDWWNARPAEYKKVGEDTRHGRWTAWHPNGQLRVEGTYDQGVPEGSFSWWYPNGQRSAAGSFRKGLKHGAWDWWHENGLRYVQGEYTDGQMSGVWMVWRENGRLAEKTDLSEAAGAVEAGSGDPSSNAQADVSETRPNAPLLK